MNVLKRLVLGTCFILTPATICCSSAVVVAQIDVRPISRSITIGTLSPYRVGTQRPQRPGGPTRQEFEESTDSRTRVAVRSRNGVYQFQYRPWQKANGESFRARLKTVPSGAKLTLQDPSGNEFAVDVNELDDVDKKYLSQVLVHVARIATGGRFGGDMSGGRFGNRAGGIDRNSGGSEGSEEPVEVEPAESREWSSAKGTYKVQAKYLSSDGEKVQLETDDGRKLDVEIAALSTTDQEYIKSRRALEARAGVVALWLDGSSPKAFFEAAASSTFSPDPIQPVEIAESFELTVPDRSGAVNVVDPKPPFLSADRRLALVPVAYGVINTDVMLEIADLSKGKWVGSFPVPAQNAIPFAVSKDNKLLYTFVDQTAARDFAQIDCWELVDGAFEPRHRVRMDLLNLQIRRPAGAGFGRTGGRGMGMNGANPALDRPTRMGLVDTNHVFIVTQREVLVIDLASGVVTHRDDIAGPPGISPGGRYIAYARPNAERVVVVDLPQQRVVQSVEIADVQDVCFSDDGRRVACYREKYDDWSIDVFDLVSGERVQQMPVPYLLFGSMYWSGDRYVVAEATGTLKENDVDPRDIFFDVQAGCPVSAFRAHRVGDVMGPSIGNGYFVGLDDDRLLVDKYPHPEWVSSEPDPHQYYIQINGSTVQVQTENLGLATLVQSQIRRAVEKKVEEAGGTVGAGGSLRLLATSRAGEPTTWPYKNPRTNETVQVPVTPCINELILFQNGEEIWRTEAQSQIQPTEGTLPAIRLAAELSGQPDPVFYSTAPLPTRIPIQQGWEKMPVYGSVIPGMPNLPGLPGNGN